MKVKKQVPLNEIKRRIKVPNPEKRRCTVSSRKSGYSEKQVFTSDVFSKEISAKLIGYYITSSKKVHPAYILEVSKKELFLKGFKGRRYGRDIMHELCRKLLSQKGILYIRNVKRSDLSAKNFDYENESKIYWLASKCIEQFKANMFLDMKFVCRGKLCSCKLVDVDRLSELIYGYGVRPVIVLDTEITNIGEIPRSKQIKP